jgi:hypothetical protein
MSIHVAAAERTVRTPPRPAITSCTSSEARQHRDEDIHLRGSAAMTALVAGVAGTAAAYAGALPDRVQEVAHVMVGAPAPHHGGPQRPAVPAPRPDTQPVLRPASQPGPGQSHAGETAKAPGQTRSPRSGHGSAKGGHGTARCCAHNPPPGQNKPGRRPDDPGKPTPSATCCPAA